MKLFLKLTQVITAKASEFNINLQIQRNLNILQQLSCLPLLPSAMIREHFEHICHTLSIEEMLVFHDLMQYMRETWFETIGIARMSCFDENHVIHDKIRNIEILGEFQRAYESTVNNALGVESSAYQFLGETIFFFKKM